MTPEPFKVRRWYCFAEDDLVHCPGKKPHLYDPDEWDHEHDDCDWVFVTSTKRPIALDFDDYMGGE